MSDYNLYSFTIKEEDLLRVLHDAKDHGYNAYVLINGMHYAVKLEEAKSDR